MTKRKAGILCAIVALAVVGAAAVLVFGPRSTPEEYDRIRLGMTLDEVVEIFGRVGRIDGFF
jgi:hypothetical protein